MLQTQHSNVCLPLVGSPSFSQLVDQFSIFGAETQLFFGNQSTDLETVNPQCEFKVLLWFEFESIRRTNMAVAILS